MSLNPVTDVIDELGREFNLMSGNCQILTQEVNALHKYIADNQNKKPARRLSRVFGFSFPLQPAIIDYKDKTRNIIEMFSFVRDHYDDLKKRYICALDQLAEMTIKFNKMVEEDLERQAREKPLGESWEEFCNEPIARTYKEVECQTETEVDEDDVGPADKEETKIQLDIYYNEVECQTEAEVEEDNVGDVIGRDDKEETKIQPDIIYKEVECQTETEDEEDEVGHVIEPGDKEETKIQRDINYKEVQCQTETEDEEDEVVDVYGPDDKEKTKIQPDIIYKDVECQTETEDEEDEVRDLIGPDDKEETKNQPDINLILADLVEFKFAVHALRAEIKEKDEFRNALQAENRNLLLQLRRFQAFFSDFQKNQLKITELNPRSDAKERRK